MRMASVAHDAPLPGNMATPELIERTVSPQDDKSPRAGRAPVRRTPEVVQREVEVIRGSSSTSFRLRTYESFVQTQQGGVDGGDASGGTGTPAKPESLPAVAEVSAELDGCSDSKDHPGSRRDGGRRDQKNSASNSKPNMKDLKHSAVRRRWNTATGVKQAVRIQKKYVADGPWEPPESDGSSGEDEAVVANDVIAAMNEGDTASKYVTRGSTDSADGERTSLHAHSSWYRGLQWYHRCGRRVHRRIVEANWFKSFIMGVIGAAAVTVGMQTYTLDDTLQWWVTSVLEPVIQWVFVAEAAVMINSFGRRPWNYFKDPWNLFDFVIVVSSFLPIGGSSVTTLRLLRLLRVLKLVKALPKLRMLVLGVLNSLSSIGYISLLLALQFYLYAVLGVIMFGTGDPYYFGTLDAALVSLWQAATGDDWSDHLYTGIFGCNAPEASDPAYAGNKGRLCENPSALGYIMPTAYFLSFQLLAGLMLLNLFVGAILMAVQDAKEEVNTVRGSRGSRGRGCAALGVAASVPVLFVTPYLPLLVYHLRATC